MEKPFLLSSNNRNGGDKSNTEIRYKDIPDTSIDVFKPSNKKHVASVGDKDMQKPSKKRYVRRRLKRKLRKLLHLLS